MTRLVLDRDTLARLGPLDKPLQICDDSGHILGVFQPVRKEDLEPAISRDEIERRKQEKSGRSLKEILADLESRQ